MNLNESMKRYDDFGAMDSEAFAAVERVEAAADSGKPFPLNSRNPFSLYESEPGWTGASIELVAAARRMYAERLGKRIGLIVYDPSVQAESPTATELVQAIERAGFEPVAYSGRGMAGRECVAVKNNSAWEIARALSPNLSLPEPAIDALGKSEVVYWPSIDWPRG